MNIGKLFVSLGIKGAKKSKDEVLGVKDALKGTASMGLEAKAAIAGAVYALQQLFAKSNQAGTDLTNFNATIGVSTQELQKYQYAARQVGVSNEAVAGSFRGLQSTITKQLMGEQAPKGLSLVAQKLAAAGQKMDQYSLAEFAKDPALLLQRLQQYAQLEQHAGLRNEVLKSFGLGDDMVAALTRNAFRPDVMAKAPTYSEGEIANLDKNNAAWANLGNKIEMAVGKFNAAHGGQLVKDISLMTDKVLALAEAFTKLAEKLKVFEVIGKAFEGWALILNAAEGGVGDMEKALANPESDISKFLKDVNQTYGGAKDVAGGASAIIAGGKGREQALGALGQFFSTMPGVVSLMLQDIKAGAKDTSTIRDPIARKNMGLPPLEQDPNYRRGMTPPGTNPQATAVPPGLGAGVTNQVGGNQTNTINQTLNFQNPPGDPNAVKNATKDAVQKAFRQLPSQAQGS